MCFVLKVSRSGYYGWLKKPKSERRKENEVILEAIKALRQEEPKKQVYGSPRLTRELCDQGIQCGKNRVAGIMKDNGIKAKTKKRFKQTTDSQHNNSIAPDLLEREFAASAPDQVYVTDITYIWTMEGWLYLAVVLDLFSRMVVGWAMSMRINTDLVIEALNMAVLSRRPGKGLIVHSDKGTQYASYDYRMRLSKYGFRQSMGSTGDCYDNAVAESFFHTMKTEWVFFERYQTRSQAKTSLFDYMETFYNRERRHSTLNYLSPWNYEQKFSMAA
jgi:transposase InsO family protein